MKVGEIKEHPIADRFFQRRSLVMPALAIFMVAACSSDNEDNSTNMTTEPAPTSDSLPTLGNTAIGQVYTAGDSSLTLYTLISLDQDPISCGAECEAVWPPLLTDASTSGINGQFDVLARSDGDSQWTLKGSPLYYYVGDGTTGEVNGEGLDGEWFVARPDPVTSANTALGETLVVFGSVANAQGNHSARDAHDGRTLYFFTSDIPGSSNCTGTCVTNWPPLYADKAAEDYNRLSVIARTDGSTQWAYDAKPLYRYIGDSAPGDINGAGVSAQWLLATP